MNVRMNAATPLRFSSLLGPFGRGFPGDSLGVNGEVASRTSQPTAHQDTWTPRKWIACPGPEVPRIRGDWSYGDLREVKNYYRQWENQLSPDEDWALTRWYGPDFQQIHQMLRNPSAPLAPDERDKHSRTVTGLLSAIATAPPIPDCITEVFRGESHQKITLEEAKAWAAEGRTITYDSFYASSLSENEAFNFARDYHASGHLADSFLRIPLASLQAPKDQQIIYRTLLPAEARAQLKAGYQGGTIREMLFAPKLTLRYVDAQNVLYLPVYDVKIQNREINGKPVPHYQEFGGQPEKRLMITMTPVLEKG